MIIANLKILKLAIILQSLIVFILLNLKNYKFYFLIITNSERLFCECSSSVQDEHFTFGSVFPYPFPEILSFIIPLESKYCTVDCVLCSDKFRL